MKAILNTLILISIAWSQAAVAASCNMDMKDAPVDYYGGEIEVADAALKPLGYIADSTKPTQLSLVILKQRESAVGCSRTVQIFGPRIDGKLPSQPLYEKESVVMGLKYNKVTDPCYRVFEKAMRAVPSCSDMLKKLGQSKEIKADSSASVEQLSSQKASPAGAL